MNCLSEERPGPWLIGVFPALFTIGLLLYFVNDSYAQDYWSSVFPSNPQWRQAAPSRDPYRFDRHVRYLSTDLPPVDYYSGRRSSDRNVVPPLVEPGTTTFPVGRQPVPGLSGELGAGWQTGSDDHLQFIRLGSWHQLLDLQLQFTRTDRLLLNVLAREADREQTSDARMALLLQEWDMEEAQSRRDWERQCPVEAAWVRDHAQWYGPDSIEALTTKLQAVTDCPPSGS